MLVYGDTPNAKEVAHQLRLEIPGATVGIRTIRFWRAEVEPADAIYLLERGAAADAIALAYQDRNVEVYFLEDVSEEDTEETAGRETGQEGAGAALSVADEGAHAAGEGSDIPQPVDAKARKRRKADA